MKLVRFTYGSSIIEYNGTLEDDHVYVANRSDGIQNLIESGIRLQTTRKNYALSDDDLHLMAPYIPGKVIGVGRNYAAHAEELDHDLPEKPLLFAKLKSSVVGPNDVISWTEDLSTQVDWEGELAVVIGRTARHISEDDAYDYVYGYTVANDISARDLQDNDNQWVRAKGLDTFCPLGPCIATRDEIPDPHDLTIVTTVNGEEMQNASTSLMMFKIPQLIAFCSQAFTLLPGDVILTGTPAGVGKGRDPQQFLKDGDEVTVTIEGIGQLRNVCKVG